jgi:Uma2 family endonuclease
LLTLPGEKPKQLVPDVAFVSYDRVGYDEDSAAQSPRVAPNVAIEILSPTERCDVCREKIRIYLAAGSELTLFDHSGERRSSGSDVIEHPALPGLRFTVDDMFRKPPPPRG